MLSFGLVYTSVGPKKESISGVHHLGKAGLKTIRDGIAVSL